jgi:hypothetical protein
MHEVVGGLVDGIEDQSAWFISREVVITGNTLRLVFWKYPV